MQHFNRAWQMERQIVLAGVNVCKEQSFGTRKVPGTTGTRCQLIDANGILNVPVFKNLLTETKLNKSGVNYGVVSAIGPQSSGKSTLSNHLFRTKFEEMNAKKGRSRTTQGVWIERAPDIEPLTLVLDLEGNDGRERGEKDTRFEKQIALFALAVSDIVLINMWCNDIGREQAANKHLLRIVFQEMVRLFNWHNKIILVFVIRDKDPETPKKELVSILMEDLQQIWDDISKPEQDKDVPYHKYFGVEVVTLSHYKHERLQFEQEVADLRQHINNLMASRSEKAEGNVIPASALRIHYETTWKQIQDNKQLNLPSHKQMLAEVRCREIAHQKYTSFVKAQEWCHIPETMKVKLVADFRERVSSLIDTYIDSYREESKYFDERIRTYWQKRLQQELLRLIYPTFELAIRHICLAILEDFKQAIDKSIKSYGVEGYSFSSAASECTDLCMINFSKKCQEIVVKQAKWDESKVKQHLKLEIEAHIAKVRDDHIGAITEKYKVLLTRVLSEVVLRLLNEATDRTWPFIRQVIKFETDQKVSLIFAELAGFTMDEQAKETIITNLRNHARKEVQKTVQYEARNPLPRMINCGLMSVFGPKQTPTSKKTNMKAPTREAGIKVLKVLSMMSAMRLDNEKDWIEDILFAAFLEMDPAKKAPLPSGIWPEVARERTLITPDMCRIHWNNFEKVMACINKYPEKLERKWYESATAATALLLQVMGIGVAGIGLALGIAG